MPFRDAARIQFLAIMPARALRALAAAALLTPTLLVAQQPGGPTIAYTVKVGDTLWDLAAVFLKDPHLWMRIYQLNKDKIADPHWIYPGQVLKLPGALANVEVSVSPGVPAPRTPAPRPEPAVSTLGRTVFSAPVPAPVAARTPAQSDSAAARTVLAGQYLRAPYVVRAGSALATGRVVESADLPGTIESAQVPIFKAYDALVIEPPPGEPAPKGQRFVVVRMGPLLPGVGQVIVPTGVVEVTRPPASGDAGVGLLVQVFGEVSPNQFLLPLDTSGVSSSARPRPAPDGRWSSILWILSEPVLATLQSYFVLDIGADDGVKPGDEFLIFRPRIASATGGMSIPEIPIGRAQALKVTPFGTTAIVTGQVQPRIEVGGLARTTAKMP